METYAITFYLNEDSHTCGCEGHDHDHEHHHHHHDDEDEIFKNLVLSPEHHFTHDELEKILSDIPWQTCRFAF